MDESILLFDQISRIRSILYLRSHLRLIQGLQFVPHSPLRDSILKVDVDEFQLEPVTRQQIYQYDLVTKVCSNVMRITIRSINFVFTILGKA